VQTQSALPNRPFLEPLFEIVTGTGDGNWPKDMVEGASAEPDWRGCPGSSTAWEIAPDEVAEMKSVMTRIEDAQRLWPLLFDARGRSAALLAPAIDLYTLFTPPFLLR